MNKEMIIYQNKSGAIELKGDLKQETVWGSLNQIAELFGRDKSVISRHIKNIYTTNELKQSATIAKIATVQKEGKRKVNREIEYYNLDVILSVGYRVDSKQATRFRIWANKILKDHLLQGYTLNQKLLKKTQAKFIELQKTITFLSEKAKKATLKGQETELLSLIQDYSKSLTYLEQFDKNELPEPKGEKSQYVLEYKEAKEVLRKVKTELISKKEATDLFAQERKESFAGIIGNIYQTFANQDLYTSLESKAAHLLYFVIKDHPFSDGNKRSGSFLFIYFLDRNNHLYKKTGERKINDNALTALALLVAESDPKEKEVMIRLIINLIA